ncbi:MAG: hypothetical protein CMH46_04825 [Muricauda sp.]|nr:MULTISPECIES: hypothetical protein [unclassified Allomuricauda]MAU14846.1 hypothetical protein [Allomuricauda sp.]
MKFLKLSCTVLLATAMVVVSCSGEDGEQGLQGLQGIPGTNGLNGNANVLRYDIAIPNSFHGPDFNFNIPIDPQELPNYVIFMYLIRKVNGLVAVFPIPGTIANDDYGTYYYVESTGDATLVIYNLSDDSPEDSLAPGTYDSVRIIAIESMNGSKSSHESLKAELKAAGVDTNDYYAVAEYFGLND